MNIYKMLLAFLLVIIVDACTTKDYSTSNFKNYSAKQILRMGKEAMEEKDYSGATKCFEALDVFYPFEPEVQQGQLNVIYAYYKGENYTSGLAAANRYIHLYPDGKHTDYAYYMKGVIGFDKNRTLLQKIYPNQIENIDVTSLHEAFFSFSEMLKKFSNSIYAQDAENRMHYLRNLLAEHELNIARFYLVRKVYVAAANRSSYIVRYFDGAPQIKNALKIMIVSYRFLGFDKQAKDALRIFYKNFPKERVSFEI